MAGDVLLPVLAGGTSRGPLTLRAVERTGWERRGIERVRSLRERYGPDPLPFTVRGRTLALVLDPEDAHRVLSGTPESFAHVTRERCGAWARLQPHGAPGPDAPERARRRRFAEEVLDTPQPVHRMAERVTEIVRDEAGRLLRDGVRAGVLTWGTFDAAWWRVVRRLVLGDAAREDRTLIEQLQRLRATGPGSLLGAPRDKVRAAFLERVRTYAEEAGRSGGDGAPASLTALAAAAPADPGTDPAARVPGWLSAHAMAGPAALRALALLATHPAQAATARAEAAGSALEGPRELPYLRGCLLESVRLWPATPLILRESTEESVWRDGTLPAGTAFVLHTPYLHRGEPAEPYGDTFTPGLWTGASECAGRANAALVPFGSGPAGCPAENLVLLTASTLLAALLEEHGYTLASHPALHPSTPVPATLDHFTLHFRVHRDEG